jgi:hypothetical protein
MNIQESLNKLKLIQMRALTHGDEGITLRTHRVQYDERVVCASGHVNEESIDVRDIWSGGWSFSASDYKDHPAYQTLWWIKALEEELNRPDWDLTNPEDMAIAVRAYKSVTASGVKPQ